jgi:hypothetical protein
MSCSTRDTSPENTRLSTADTKIQDPKQPRETIQEQDQKRNKPAVTKVLLCTKELTGVGAAIARGSQPQKGNCALLVNPVKSKNNTKLTTKKEVSIEATPEKTNKTKK